MDSRNGKALAPVKIARIARRRITKLGLPPTPSNYAREYRRAAGVPLVDDEQLAQTTLADAELLEMVKGVIQLLNQNFSGLAIGVDRFEIDSKRLLADTDQIRNKHDLARVLTTLTASAFSFQQAIQHSRREINETRQRLQHMEIELQRSQAMARTDPLTGMCNRRGMDEMIAREVARARRTGTPFSIAIIDLDHFKKVNDQYGHHIGDKALVHLAAVAQASLRETDVICRYGGEEFVLVLPGAGADGAQFVAERLRMMVENTPFVQDRGKITLRVSAGVADLHSGENAEALLRRADQALFDAKRAGRNRVIVAKAPASQNGGAAQPSCAASV